MKRKRRYSMTLSNRAFLQWATPLSVLLLLVLSFGCNGGQPGESESVAALEEGQIFKHLDGWIDPTTTPEEGGCAVFRMSGAPDFLNPTLYSSRFEMTIYSLLSDGIITNDIKLQPLHEGIGEVELLPDKKTYRIRIKEAAKWHDGMPVIADDIIFHYELAMDPKTNSPTKSSSEDIERIEKIDERTVKVVMKDSIATGIWKATVDPMPKHYFDREKKEWEAQGREWVIRQSAYNRSPLGNGPYKFVSWSADNIITLERWEDYPFKKPLLKKIIFKVMSDTSSAFNSFKVEEIDLMETSSEQFVKLAAKENFQKIGRRMLAVNWGYSYVGWNMDGSNPFFTDKRVRQALAMAVDIDEIIETMTYGLAQKSIGMWHPTAWMYNPNVKHIGFDPDRAIELLEEAGWVDDDTDGIVEKDGRKFEFELMTPNSPNSIEMAATLQAYWKDIGVECKIRNLEWATFSERVHNADFQAEMAGWGAGIDPDFSWNLWHSTQYKIGRNYGKYANARVDELLKMGRYEFDPEKRKRIYQEMQKLIYEDQPYLFI
jgi:peptide/nickel transport system substrate-binding protein